MIESARQPVHQSDRRSPTIRVHSKSTRLTDGRSNSRGSTTPLIAEPPPEHSSATPDSPVTPDNPVAHNSELESNISQRIRARLPGRVRCLTVDVSDQGVTLAGQCNTYHTKQLAQHVAMGVLDYQRLVNNIAVEVMR